MNIKKATIVGVLQDWDIHDYRFDIERVRINVPLEELAEFTDDEIMNMVAGAYFYDDCEPLDKLVHKGIENGWFEHRSRWEFEDPYDLRLKIEEEE